MFKIERMIIIKIETIKINWLSPDHTLAMVEKLDGFSVERKVIGVLIVEEVDGVLVEPEGEGLEEGDVVGHDFLVREVELVDNDGVDMVVGEEVVDAGLVLDVLKEDVEGLEELDADVVIADFLVHDLEEEAEHVPLEEEVKDAAVILVAPDEDLCYGPDSLDQEAFIALCHCLVLGQHLINVICRAKPLQ